MSWRMGRLAALCGVAFSLVACGAQLDLGTADAVPAVAQAPREAPVSGEGWRTMASAGAATVNLSPEATAKAKEREQAVALQLALDQGQMAQAAALATTPALWQMYSEGQRAHAQARITEEETARGDREVRSAGREP